MMEKAAEAEREVRKVGDSEICVCGFCGGLLPAPPPSPRFNDDAMHRVPSAQLIGSKQIRNLASVCFTR